MRLILFGALKAICEDIRNGLLTPENVREVYGYET